jgi:hypothetical protein
MLARQALYCLNYTSVHFALVILEMGVLRTLCPGWPLTSVLLITTSQVARITSVSHWHPAQRESFDKMVDDR